MPRTVCAVRGFFVTLYVQFDLFLNRMKNTGTSQEVSAKSKIAETRYKRGL